jgi:hypothetical protein
MPLLLTKSLNIPSKILYPLRFFGNSMKMKPLPFVKTLTVAFFGVGLTTGALAQERTAPSIFAPYLKPDEIAKGEVVAVLPPEQIQPFIEKVKEASQNDREWFEKYSADAQPGVPLPYHEKLGLTKAEYDQYLTLWEQRDFKKIQDLAVRLEKMGDQWVIRVGGAGAKITLLRYHEEKDEFKSPNGTLRRIEDIKAAPESILRGWTGHEWKFEEKGALGTTKENFAIGKTEDEKSGLLVYRLQDMSASGRALYDQSVLIRFDLPSSANKE